jgi:hypothetical protein
MTSWRLLARPDPDRRVVAAVHGAHLCAAALPWLLPLSVLPAVMLSLASLALWPFSRRCLPRIGRLQALALDPRCCALRLDDGWWPARLLPGCRVHRDLVLLRAASPAGTVVALLGRDSLAPADFRRLKCLLRVGAGGENRLC